MKTSDQCKTHKELSEYRSGSLHRDVNKEIIVLKGILKGIAIDDIINQDEIDELRNWCASNVLLHTMEPYKSIVATLESALDDGVITSEEFEDIEWACDKASNSNSHPNKAYDLVTRGLQELNGIFHGVAADGIISEDEVRRLSDWINDNDFLKSTYPYDEIESLVCSILADGVVSQDERDMLMAFMGMFIDTKVSLHVNYQDEEDIKKTYNIEGICSVNCDITLKGKRFCFTGTSKKAKRDDIANLVKSRGGIFINSVTKDTDYLIYGADGSPCWAFTCHGRKVEKAVELRKQGFNITIIHELDFWDALEDCAVIA